MLILALTLVTPAWTSGKTDETVRLTAGGFDPATVRIVRGDTVTWTNDDMFDHNVIAADESFASDDLGNGDTFSHVFATAGDFSYICSIHPYMTGTVTVAG